MQHIDFPEEVLDLLFFLDRTRQRNPLIIDCDTSPKFPRTKLHNKLCSLDTGSQFAHQFLDAEFVLSELGPSAADWFWRCWMDGRVASRAETENWSAVPVTDTTSTTFLKSIEEWDFQLEDISASSSLNITPRVFQLVQLLVTQKSQCSTFRGVVVGMW